MTRYTSLELEPAELNVCHLLQIKIRTVGVRGPYFLMLRPRDGALYWKSHHHFCRPAARLWLLPGAET